MFIFNNVQTLLWKHKNTLNNCRRDSAIRPRTMTGTAWLSWQSSVQQKESGAGWLMTLSILVRTTQKRLRQRY